MSCFERVVECSHSLLCPLELSRLVNNSTAPSQSSGDCWNIDRLRPSLRFLLEEGMPYCATCKRAFTCSSCSNVLRKRIADTLVTIRAYAAEKIETLK